MKRKIRKKGYDIVVFDCDSTLSAVEGIDLLAKRHGVKKEVEEMTHNAMNGHSGFTEALSARLELVKPVREDLYWLGRQYIKQIVPGTKKLIADLKKAGKDVYIISGGFEAAIRIFADFIGVEESHVFCNVLRFNNDGEYIDFDHNNPLSKNHGKRTMLLELAKLGKTMFIGDGVTDLEGKDAVDLFVGFGGISVRDVVKKEADVFIVDKTLEKVGCIALGKRPNY